MADNTTGFEFNEVPGSPKSKASATNLNNAIEKALIRNIDVNAVKPAHIDPSNAGAGLVGGGGASLAVNTDGKTLEVNSDKVRIKDGGVGSTQIADGAITMDKLADAVKTTINTLIKSIYKVGDYFITHNAEDPAKRFGGQWELVKDKFLIGAGGDYGILSEGGEKEHTLTVDEMPKHTHGANYSDGGGKYCQVWRKDLGANSGDSPAGHTDEFVDNAGGDQPHNNMPPYKAVYIWVKISDEDTAE